MPPQAWYSYWLRRPGLRKEKRQMANTSNDMARRVAETVRAACVRAALEAYESASMDGLCHEGAWEAAIDAMRSMDLDAVLQGSESR